MGYIREQGLIARHLPRAALAAALLYGSAFSQADYFLRGTLGLYTADTLYIGGEIARTGVMPATVRVTLKENGSGLYVGMLGIWNPTTSAWDDLFLNNAPIGTNVDVTAQVNAYGLNNPIRFRYRITTGASYVFYSGPNIPGVTPAAFLTAHNSDANFRIDKRYGRRFSAVGKSKTAGALDGNFEIGFEDEADQAQDGPGSLDSWSDMDYNDIIVGITGGPGMKVMLTKHSNILLAKGFVW